MNTSTMTPDPNARNGEHIVAYDPAEVLLNGNNNGTGHAPAHQKHSNPTEQDRATMAQQTESEVKAFAGHRFGETNAAEREKAAAKENASIRLAQLVNLPFEVLFQTLKGLDPF